MTSSLATAEEPSGEEDESLWKPPPRVIFYNTARDDGGLDEFGEGTWKHLYKEQSLVALHRRMKKEELGRRSGLRLFSVVLDLPPGNSQMESSSRSPLLQWQAVLFSMHVATHQL